MENADVIREKQYFRNIRSLHSFLNIQARRLNRCSYQTQDITLNPCLIVLGLKTKGFRHYQSRHGKVQISQVLAKGS